MRTLVIVDSEIPEVLNGIFLDGYIVDLWSENETADSAQKMIYFFLRILRKTE
jgi:hypothetical protein